MRYSLAEIDEFRDTAKRAYLKALASSELYEAEGLKLRRYALEKLRLEYEYWCDVKNMVERFGTTSHPIMYRRVIPMDA